MRIVTLAVILCVATVCGVHAYDQQLSNLARAGEGLIKMVEAERTMRDIDRAEKTIMHYGNRAQRAQAQELATQARDEQQSYIRQMSGYVQGLINQARSHEPTRVTPEYSTARETWVQRILHLGK